METEPGFSGENAVRGALCDREDDSPLYIDANQRRQATGRQNQTGGISVGNAGIRINGTSANGRGITKHPLKLQRSVTSAAPGVVHGLARIQVVGNGSVHRINQRTARA